MSFNFSDIEDEDEFDDLEEFDETGLLAQASSEREATTPAVATNTPYADQAAFDHDAEDSDGGDWDSVEWEDAADEGDDADNEQCEETSLPAFPQEGITIHIGRRLGTSNNPDDDNQREDKKNEEVVQDKPSKKKPRKFTVRVLRNVSPETQQLVLNIRRSHMLCCMIHSQQCSFLCSGGGGDVSGQDETTELLNTALSLIPQEFHTEHTPTSFIIPTASAVKIFATWFSQFVNQAGQRRRRALGRNAAQGAAIPSARKRRRSNDDLNSLMDQSQQLPSTSTLLQRLRHLSPCYDEEPQLFLEQEGVDPIEAVECITSQEKVMLLLVMVRSMRWRARYVTAFKAIPLTVTVDHPLFKVSNAASLDVKPPAYTWRDTNDLLLSMIRLMKEGNVTKNGKTSGRKKRPRRSQKTAAAASKHKVGAIDLVSSGEEEEGQTTQKEMIPANDNLLSWIEVLRSKDGKKGGEKEMAVTSLKNSKTKPAAKWSPILLEQESIDQPELVENILAWMENEADNANKGTGQVKPKGKWTSKKGAKLDRGNAHRTPKKSPVSYVVAVEHLSNAQGVRFTDVTRRYANMWSRTLSLRGATFKDIKQGRGQCVDEWFQISLKKLNNCFKPTTEGQGGLPTKRESKSTVRSVTKVRSNNGKLVEVLELESSDDEDDTKPAAKRRDNVDHFDTDDHVIDEKEELHDNSTQEVIPKNKASFKNHPFYVIQCVLNSKEVLHPDAKKRICGVFKGQLVYRRSDVSIALTAKKWLYEGCKVKDSELSNPAKKVKTRKKPKTKGFAALESYGITESAQNEAIALLDEKKEDTEDENMDKLYGKWQTRVWSPPYVSPSDPIPTNEFKNVEKALLNPGLTHMEQPRLAGIARKLGVLYAPCMLGFERHGGRGTPSIKGIVVHDHNVGLIREASIEWESHVAEKERSEHRTKVLKLWKRLAVGVLTKERLERDYVSH